MIEPLVTVVVPTYNSEKTIKRALDSVSNQLYENWECLVCDDGSDDTTTEIVQLFVDVDSRFELIRCKHYGNANVMRNIGTRHAKGDYIAMLDSDDEYVEKHLLNRVNFIQGKDCDGIYGGCYINDNGKIEERISRKKRKNESWADFLLSGGICPTPSHFYKKKAIQSILWDENLKRHQDFDLTIRFGGKFKFCCDPDASVIIHWESGISRNLHFSSCIYFLEKHSSTISQKTLRVYVIGMYLNSFLYNAPPNVSNYYRDWIKKLGLRNVSIKQFLIAKFPRAVSFYLKASGKFQLNQSAND